MLRTPVIVINSSPAINLTRALDSLAILPLINGRIVVPTEVMQELEIGRTKDKTAEVLRDTPGMQIRFEPTKISALIATELDLGEASVIEIAIKEKLKTVLLDDLKARRLAKLLGLNVTGSLGVLIQAKRAGHISLLRPLIKRMRDRGTWLDETVIVHALRLAGET